MAKRKTIGDNPLDAVAPDPVAGRREEKSAAPKPRAPVPGSTAKAPPVQASVKPEKRAATPAQATRTESPTQNELLNRIQSIEEQNQLIKWLAYGAIGLALLL